MRAAGSNSRNFNKNEHMRRGQTFSRTITTRFESVRAQLASSGAVANVIYRQKSVLDEFAEVAVVIWTHQFQCRTQCPGVSEQVWNRATRSHMGKIVAEIGVARRRFGR